VASDIGSARARRPSDAPLSTGDVQQHKDTDDRCQADSREQEEHGESLPYSRRPSRPRSYRNVLPCLRAAKGVSTDSAI
jgi:hypothetical protein